jgi:hypothetical protein
VCEAARHRGAQGCYERNGADDAAVDHDLLPFAACVLVRGYFG